MKNKETNVRMAGVSLKWTGSEVVSVDGATAPPRAAHRSRFQFPPHQWVESKQNEKTDALQTYLKTNKQTKANKPKNTVAYSYQIK